MAHIRAERAQTFSCPYCTWKATSIVNITPHKRDIHYTPMYEKFLLRFYEEALPNDPTNAFLVGVKQYVCCEEYYATNKEYRIHRRK